MASSIVFAQEKITTKLSNQETNHKDRAYDKSKSNDLELQ